MQRSIISLIGADMIAQSNKELGNDILKSNRELGKKLESISEAEIKSKDRVDISLEEYERMKKEINSLSYEVNRLKEILGRIEIPFDKEIIPDSIVTYWADDIIHFKRRFRVEFDINTF